MSIELDSKDRVDATKHLGRLKDLKANDNKAGFNELLYQILIPVRKYVEHEIQVAEINKVITKNDYQVDALMDDLLIKTFDKIENIDVQQHLLSWLFQQADIMLEDLYVEEEFNAVFHKNIDDLSQPELDAMEELITRDADGDLVLLEDLDDMSYADYQYVLDDIFISDPEQSIISDIDAGLIKENTERSITKMIRFLPSRMRSIYNLHHHGLDANSISFIKRIPVDRVNTTIHKVRRTLRHLLAIELDKDMVDKK